MKPWLYHAFKINIQFKRLISARKYLNVNAFENITIGEKVERWDKQVLFA